MTRRRHGLQSRESGETLIEVVMATAIMGVAVITIVGGMAQAILASGIHRRQAEAEIVLISAADAVKSQRYQICPATYPTNAVSLPTGWSEVLNVQYWNGSAFAAACPAPALDLLQQVTVRVTSPDGRATESVAVVIRNRA